MGETVLRAGDDCVLFLKIRLHARASVTRLEVLATNCSLAQGNHIDLTAEMDHVRALRK